MIIGTAGHIDHGKTALVRALTGVDADRLKEEKARGITIDLGFAYLPSGDDDVLGFVDVPGHDRFVRNMLAGATGIDFMLLVVAADDGVMPQTREHFDIINLLGLTKGCVALTKCDLVSAERQAEVTTEVRNLLSGTPLANAPIYPLSTHTGVGVDALRDALMDANRTFVSPADKGLFRLAVDRCFSLQGVGTVVTGAVLSGSVSRDELVTISPSGLTARVRNIHAQNRSADEGHLGQRCALNLTGEDITTSAIERGDMVVAPAAHAPADRLDAHLQLLSGEPRALQHWTPVRLHHGASETGARVAVLQNDPIAPGQSAYIQLVLEKPIAATVGDRFIIRDTSGSRTMGGGRLLDLRGPNRHRKTPERLAQLDALARPTPEAALTALLECAPFVVDIDGFVTDRAMNQAEIDALLKSVPHVRARGPSVDMVVSEPVWQKLTQSAMGTLDQFHRTYPQLLGPGINALARSLRPRLKISTGKTIIRELVARGTLVSQGGAIRLPGQRLALDASDNKIWRKLQPLLSEGNRFRPPQGRECAQQIGERQPDVKRVLKAMAKQHTIVELAPDRYFLRSALKEMAGIAGQVAAQQEDGYFSAAQFRDELNNGRKVAIEILEYFDRNGLTMRSGDLRRIVPHRLDEYASQGDENGEENRSRWGVRTSNPGGAVSQP